MPADLLAIAHVRRLLLELGFEEAPEQIVPAALGYSLWVSLPIAELAGRTPKELVADAEGSAAWLATRAVLAGTDLAAGRSDGLPGSRARAQLRQ